MSFKKLKGNYAFLFDQASFKGHHLDPWRSAFNRMLRELVMDFQEAKKFPNPTYFSKQVALLREQAKNMVDDASEKSASWEDVLLIARESDIYTEILFDESRHIFSLKSFSMLHPVGLSEAASVQLANTVGGFYHKESGHIRLNIMALELFHKPDIRRESRIISISKSILMEHVDSLAACEEGRAPYRRPAIRRLLDYLFIRSVR